MAIRAHAILIIFEKRTVAQMNSKLNSKPYDLESYTEYLHKIRTNYGKSSIRYSSLRSGPKGRGRGLGRRGEGSP